MVRVLFLGHVQVLAASVGSPAQIHRQISLCKQPYSSRACEAVSVESVGVFPGRYQGILVEDR